ncbi:MAG TPA: IclR family transcriptional regulator [Trebonia sp.]
MSTDPSDAGKPRPPAPAVASAMRILEYIAHVSPEATVSAIAGELGLNKSTCFNILKTLAECGYVAKDSRYPVYRLGPKLVELGTAARRNYSYRAQVKRQLVPVVEKFRLAGVIGQLLPGGAGIVVVDRVAPADGRVVTAPIGEVYPLWAPAMGRAYLATLPFEEVASIEDVVSRAQGPSGLVRLKTELDLIRELGYATSRDDTEGASAVACAVADPDGNAALVLCLVGATSDLPEESLGNVGRALRDTCREVEATLRGAEGGVP